jgi:hypothetical protein
MEADMAQGIEQRLAALEQSNHLLRRGLRRTRGLALGLGLLGGVLVLTAAGEKVRVIEVQEVRVVDKKGNLRVSLTANPAGPGMALFDETGELVKGSFLLTEGTPLISLKDGESRATLSSSGAKGAMMVLQAADGGRTISTAQEGAGAVIVQDAAGVTQFKAP